MPRKVQERPFFPDGEDRESWAAESAAVWLATKSESPDEGRTRWWRRAGRSRRWTSEVDNLAASLSAIHKDVYAAGQCHQALIHLPDPCMLPLPVQLGIWAMEGERDQQLRTLAQADDPEAIEAPIVATFTTERLGIGLKSMHYQRDRDGSAASGYLNYVWRSEKYETDLRLFTFCQDLGRLQRALPDIDELAQAIEIVPRPS